MAGWSSGKETPELKASLQTIKEGASEIIDSIDKRIRELTYDRVEQNRAPEGFVSVIEGINIPEDELPFVSPEANQPAGFIKVEPPVSVEDFKTEQPITLTAEKPAEVSEKQDSQEKDSKESTEKVSGEKKPEIEKEKAPKKSSITKKLDAKKKESAKTAKQKKDTKNKDLQEAI